METICLNFLDIFKKIITDYDLTYSDIANIFLCSESTVPSYISGRTKISIDKAELLKAFLLESFDDDIYDKYIFNFSNDGFLFHGSRQGIKGDITPNYSYSRNRTDFGKGFYLGESFKQSSTFVAEEESGLDRIYQFVFNTNGLKVLELSNLDWILFIGFNRNKIVDNEQNHKLLKRMQSIKNSDYDVIIGPIADDKMSQNMEDFFADRLTYGQILKCLTQLKIGKQYCLKTEKACKNLECVGIYALDDTYRYLIKEYAFEQRDNAVMSVNKIASSKDDKGLRFSELVRKYGRK